MSVDPFTLGAALCVGFAACPLVNLWARTAGQERARTGWRVSTPRHRHRSRSRTSTRLAWVTYGLLPTICVGLVLPLGPGDWFGVSQTLLLVICLYALGLTDLLSLTVDGRLILAGIGARLVSLGLWQPEAMAPMLLGMFSGAGVIALVGMGYRIVRGREGFGEGDAGTMGLIGAFVGWQGVFPVLAASAMAGLLVAIPALLLSGRSWGTRLPFVPFLALGALAMYGLRHWSGAAQFVIPGLAP